MLKDEIMHSRSYVSEDDEDSDTLNSEVYNATTDFFPVMIPIGDNSDQVKSNHPSGNQSWET